MAKVRLLNPGMDSFTSFMGPVEFVNGVSVDHVSKREIAMLGAITLVEVIEDDGRTYQGGDAAAMVDMGDVPAPSEMTLERTAEEEAPEQITPAPQEIAEVDPTPEPEAQFTDPDDPIEQLRLNLENTSRLVDEASAPQAQPEAPTAPAIPIASWTRETLEVIADEQGIKGLREVADLYGLKDSSINGLIDKILSKKAEAPI